MATEKIRINGQWVIPVVKTKGGGGGGSDIEVVQETGQSTTSVMSQKAVTDALSDKVSLDKLSSDDFSVDAETGEISVIGGGSYILPQATENALGGIKASAKTDNETVEAKIGTDGKLYVPDGGGTYTLPTASASTKGGIKVGEGLAMSNETLSALSEVYVGAVQPSVSDGYKVWLDTEGDAPSGGAELTLLWTNSNTGTAGQEYSANTETLDLTDYAGVFIVAKIKAGYSSCATQLCMKGIMNRLFVGAYDNGVLFYDRLANVTDSGVQFYDASSNGQADNHVLFPLYIYGIK